MVICGRGRNATWKTNLWTTRWWSRCGWWCTSAGGGTLSESFVARSGASFGCLHVLAHNPDSVKTPVVPGGPGLVRGPGLEWKLENQQVKTNTTRTKRLFFFEEGSLFSSRRGPPSWVSQCLVRVALLRVSRCRQISREKQGNGSTETSSKEVTPCSLNN